MNKLAFLLLLLASLAQALPADDGLKIGAPAPETLGHSLDGGRIHLRDYRGKVVVVSFWASWCPPCRQELPVLEKIQRSRPDDIQVFVTSYRESRRTMKKLHKALGKNLSLTLVHDRSGSLARKFGVKVVPNLFVFGRDGRLVAHEVGYGEGAIDHLVDILNCALQGGKDCQKELPACETRQQDGKTLHVPPAGSEACQV